ncbi:MAG: MobF family relaxase [Phycisphaerales bacterium JB058]
MTAILAARSRDNSDANTHEDTDMLRITPCGSARATQRYYESAFEMGAYYANEASLGQELIGDWGGDAARRLRLTGVVTREAFSRLCENAHPKTGERLTSRTKTNRRVAYDFNFHAPKSLSCMLELCGDARLADAFRESVRETMLEIEREAKTRVRVGGQDTTRITGNMLWSEFVHSTARPVDGVPDPHLHVHSVVQNCTYDAAESKWKAIDVGDIKRDAPYFQAAFHARLAERVRDLGYGIRRTASTWEIDGVPESVIAAFSRRTDEIERKAAELGITDPEAKANLGASTREKKSGELSMSELRAGWVSRLSAEERTKLDRVHAMTDFKLPAAIDLDHESARAFDRAIADGFERSSVLPERRLLAAALVYGVGRVTPESVTQELARRVEAGDILRGTHDDQPMVTTPAVLAEERSMIETVRDSRGRHKPLKPEHIYRNTELSAEQRKAVDHVLTSPDGTVAVTGRAGVGKTRLMREVVDAIEATGRTVHVAAPTAMATHETLKADGFAQARTIASLLHDERARESLKGQVLWVDEAGLISAPDMARLVRLTHESGARLVLTGDTRQHRSVVRGDALRLLETEAGITPVEIAEVRRQKVPEYRRAAEELARGDTDRSFDRLERMGAVREVVDEERPKELAETYRQSVNAGRSTLVIAPTHAEGRKVTDAIRERLKQDRQLGDREHAVTRLVSRNLTEAQRADPASYEAGDVIQFAQNVKGGFRKGERAEVTETGGDGVVARRERDGRAADLPLTAASRFDVYQRQQLDIAAGDRVRFTRGGRTECGKHQLYNGTIYGVRSVDESGTMTLDNGWRVGRDFGHLTHGYCVTSDASQGRTVGHVILAQSSESVGATSSQQFYTSVTRGRERVTVFTDDRHRLRQNIRRDATRLTATELMRSQAMKPPERGLSNRRSIGRWLQERVGIRRQRESGERTREQTRQREQQTRARDRGIGGRERER